MEPKYNSFEAARSACIDKYNPMVLTGEDWIEFCRYTLDVASRYLRFIRSTTGIKLPFYSD